jgi:hypothetical protein
MLTVTLRPLPIYEIELLILSRTIRQGLSRFETTYTLGLDFLVDKCTSKASSV